MCRFVAYIGHDALIEDILVKPVNSLISQSLHARETDMPTNGDGFGLGWYVPQLSTEPALFKSIQPAWNDSNLLHLSAKIKSPCFLSHVRAASHGGVSHDNCHPFMYQDYLFMHNGGIYNFAKIKRHLRHLLEDDIYESIQGETDSEHAFHLFLQLAKGRDLSNIEVVAITLEETIAQIERLVSTHGGPGDSNLNFVLTDGKQLVACRYHSEEKQTPRTLHFSVGDAFVKKGDRYHMIEGKGNPHCVLVTSERLTDFNCEWQDVPVNHLVCVSQGIGDEKIVKLRKMAV
ncbi:class II glutamine amidotransferase [Legionella sp. W05-934-2]|jgi:glutamine amidotransferase|uniref:class II glutamine amidotransferase n=1 Tax=Legionella sp. W05-934-2 TaxID=1198649 RepID=UPI0034627C1D